MTDFRPLADALRAEIAKPLREDTMTNKHVGSQFDLAEFADTAVERVAKAIAIHFMDEIWSWESIATAAIAAHSAYLRERVYAPDVAAAGAKYFMDNPAEVKLLAMAVIAGEMDKASVSRDVLHYTVIDIVESALDAMLGKENHDERRD